MDAPLMPSSKYTNNEVEVGLVAYALNGGNKTLIDRALKAQDIDIPASTVSTWANDTHRERYMKVRTELEDALHTKLADLHVDLAMRMLKIEQSLVEQAEEILAAGGLDYKEVASLMRVVAPAAGIHSDKALAFAGKPREIIQHNFVDITQIAAAQGIFIRPAGQPDALHAAEESDAKEPPIPSDRRLSAGED